MYKKKNVEKCCLPSLFTQIREKNITYMHKSDIIKFLTRNVNIFSMEKFNIEKRKLNKEKNLLRILAFLLCKKFVEIIKYFFHFNESVSVSRFETESDVIKQLCATVYFQLSSARLSLSDSLTEDSIEGLMFKVIFLRHTQLEHVSRAFEISTLFFRTPVSSGRSESRRHQQRDKDRLEKFNGICSRIADTRWKAAWKGVYCVFEFVE